MNPRGAKGAIRVYSINFRWLEKRILSYFGRRLKFGVVNPREAKGTIRVYSIDFRWLEKGY